MQISDTIIWQGENYYINCGSLDFHKCFPEVQLPSFDFISTACWRRYIATWIIDIDGWLKLARIGTGLQEVDLPNGNRDFHMGAIDQLYNIFPNQEGPVAAFGFTGDITVGYGADVHRHGYLRSYPNYKVFSILNGKIAKLVEHDRAWWLADKGDFING
ncbi:MAG: hypothetical protein Q8L73_00110 [Methylotenera sp.]|nr:hypothetical protein [Methylotenera sp.]